MMMTLITGVIEMYTCKTFPIEICTHLRKSLENREQYTLSLYRDSRIIPFKECWDVVREQLYLMIGSGIEDISDEQINHWIATAHELGFQFYYQHQQADGKQVVNYIAVERINKEIVTPVNH